MQDKNGNAYSYLSAGFDRFFNRSITGEFGFSLDATEGTGQAAGSKTINYDSSSVTGALGDLITIGDILLDGVEGNIDLIDDGKVTVRISSRDE